MEYHSQYRSHDLFELQHSLSGLSKTNLWVKLTDRLPWDKIEKQYNKRHDNQFFNMLTLMEQKKGRDMHLAYLLPSGPIMKENPIAEIPLVSSREEYISPNDIRKSDPHHGLSNREHRTHRQVHIS